ncbi:MAG TPA: DUF6088 family protein [Candidatus Limnocylindrales bacterium]|nr:DUF6088 family protein [Candidatus Limnocylindrales bacterium]
MKTSTAATIKRRVRRARPGTFLRVADLATDHHHRHAVEHALSRLAASDAPIVRARKGLYYRGVSSRFGKTRPRPMEVALEVTRGAGSGPAGWSALRALGLTTQVPSVDEVAVVGAAPTGVDGVRFHVRRSPDRLHLTFDEIAALEAIRAWPTHGEGDAEALRDAVRGLASEGRIRPERLVKAAHREPPSVRASLGQLFAAAA